MVETVPRAVPFEYCAHDLKMSHMTSTTNTIQNTAQHTTSSRTTTPSAAMTGRMTTKQINPVPIHPDTSSKAPLGHCMHVHQPAVQVCKPGELLAMRKVTIFQLL